MRGSKKPKWYKDELISVNIYDDPIVSLRFVENLGCEIFSF